MIISKYVAQVQLQFDKKSIANVDKQLKAVEAKIRNFGKTGTNKFALDLNNFNVDQRALNIALGNALNVASARSIFTVSRFSVDQSHLNRTMAAAMRTATNLANRETRLRPNVAPASGQGGRGLASRAARSAGVGGAIGGGLSRLYGPAVALGLGGYGLGALNQRNQQVVSAQLQSSAVVQQAGGTAQQGAASFEYLRNEGQRIGFNYLDASGDYNKLISGLTGSGVGLDESQKVFSGFAELARVNKLDKTTQNRLFRALSQVAGKGKLQAEELTGQIAESLPGGTALFAKAYQDQIGGNKTGQEAISQLMADMKKGKVKSSILTFAGSRASNQANAGGALSSASTASQAEQARYQNSVNDLAVMASNNGVEEGFARIFRTLNAGLSESGSLVRGLSSGFNEATKWADDLLLFPQSFVRALEGKDSLVADWLGIESTKQLREDWQSIKEAFTSISQLKFDFLPTLESTTKEIAAILNSIAGFSEWIQGQKTNTNKVAYSDVETIKPFGGDGYKSPAGMVGAFLNNANAGFNAARERGQAVYGDPNSPYFNDPAGYDAQQRDIAMASAQQSVSTQASFTFGDINISLPAGSENMSDGDKAQQFANMVQFHLNQEIEKAMPQFTNKE